MEKIRFLTVARFDHPTPAWIFRNQLDDVGIDAFVIDEHINTLLWTEAIAYGGIKVQIPANQLNRFKQLQSTERMELVEHQIARQTNLVDDDSKNEPNTFENCESCGSASTKVHYWNRPLIFLSILFLWFPIPIRARSIECFDCGHHKSKFRSFLTTHGKTFLATLVFFVILIYAIFKFHDLPIFEIGPGHQQ